MLKSRILVAAVAGVAGLCATTTASAGATGNVGAFSEYLFRGVEQSNGAAVQGGLDYAHESGLYVGTWISNTSFAGTNGRNVGYETDVYGGYTTKIGDLGLDFGGLYYYYADDTKLNTIEGYAGFTYGMFKGKVFYTPDYFSTDEDGIYITGGASIPLIETVSLDLSVGYSFGDGVKAFLLDEYLDYSVGISKTFDAGFVFSFSLVGNTLGDTAIATSGEKLLISLKKSFEF